MYIAQSHLFYLLCSIGLTVWVGRTIHRHGRIFLVDTFTKNEPLADSVNALLVVGFYLINIGYVALTLRDPAAVDSLAQLIEVNSVRLGRVLLVLGGMHFFNLYVFSRMRRRAMLHQAPPPITTFERLVHEAAR